MINVHFSEITLKGKNRALFENQLVKNIHALSDEDLKIIKKDSRILITARDEFAVKDALMRTFGADSIFLSTSTELDVERIVSAVLSLSDKLAGKSIRVKTKRANKSFPLTSQKVNEIVGKALVDSGCSVDLKNPDETVYVEILSDIALVSVGRFKGMGGLPVGCSGKVLSLLSGGIDSPVASLLMMGRGCSVDLLHIHSMPASKDVRDSKIMDIMRKMREYYPSRIRLFAFPYSEFYKKTLKLDSRKELVVFRRFILRLANDVAKEHACKALVTGDSLGQVASQTLDNLSTTDESSDMPVFRPLIGLNKQEIVDLSIKFGTYDISIKPYKDCCSLVAHKNPSTRVRTSDAKKIEEDIGIQEIIEKTMKLCEIIEF